MNESFLQTSPKLSASLAFQSATQNLVGLKTDLGVTCWILKKKKKKKKNHHHSEKTWIPDRPACTSPKGLGLHMCTITGRAKQTETKGHSTFMLALNLWVTKLMISFSVCKIKYTLVDYNRYFPYLVLQCSWLCSEVELQPELRGKQGHHVSDSSWPFRNTLHTQGHPYACSITKLRRFVPTVSLKKNLNFKPVSQLFSIPQWTQTKWCDLIKRELPLTRPLANHFKGRILLGNLGWPGTLCVDQDGLQLTELLACASWVWE